jgi:hypothetical protein
MNKFLQMKGTDRSGYSMTAQVPVINKRRGLLIRKKDWTNIRIVAGRRRFFGLFL